MSADAEWPALTFRVSRRAPARRSFFWTSSDLIAGACLVAVAALVVVPLANLVRIALSGESDIWADLVTYVIPEALRVTVLLLAGVAALTALIGVGAAWLVTAYRFPGRDTLAWALALPLAFPTYIVAYVYVDLFDAFGPVQSLLTALTGWKPTAASWYPNIRSLPGASLRLFARALSVRVPGGTRDVPDAEREPVRGRAHARRDAFHAGAPCGAAARAARAGGRAVARAARNAERHRRLRISRRAHADALDLHHLAQPLEPARRRADRLRDAGRDRRADRARTLRPARQAFPSRACAARSRRRRSC